MIKIAKAYYASRISDNQAKTPEGYLICLNVPIARTGWQEYMPSELGIEGNLPVQLYRSEDEVFNPASIASFEGKPVTSEHPPDWLSPTNVASYMRGVANNVRRGKDTESDLLLADLIIYDPILAAEIGAGKRETSSGYDYACVPLEGEDAGKYAQKNIRGNHVAIVREGRAGARVAVKDEKPKQEKERGKKMPKIDKNTLLGKIFKAFAVDAEPEELAEASKLLTAEGKDETPPAAAPAVKPAVQDQEMHSEQKEEKFFGELLAAIKGLQADVAELKAGKTQEPAADALTELEKEMTNGQPDPVTDEDPVTIDPTKLEDEAPVSNPEDRPENPIPGADSKAAVLAAIKAVKPVVAAIKDPAERKKASDALAKTFREQLKIEAPKSDPYKSMVAPKKPKTAQDQKPDDGELGEYLKKKYNPHFKEKK